MSITEAKILARMVTEMQTTRMPFDAAWNVCHAIKAEATELWGPEKGQEAFEVTAKYLARQMATFAGQAAKA